MPNSYTPLLRLTLPADGELVGTWGQTVNNGITSLEESAIAGTAAVPMADANQILTVANGAVDQARSAILNATGALTAQRDIVVPSSSKTYIVRNNTTGGFGVNVKTAAGTGVVVAAGTAVMVYCDGVNVMPAVSGGPLAIPLGTAAAPDLSFVGDPNTGLYSPLADTFAVTTAGVERLRVTAAGDTIVGPPMTGTRFNVNHVGGVAAAVQIGDAATPASETGIYLRSTTLANITWGTGGALLFKSTGGANERMRITDGGNVSIGPNTTTAKLNVFSAASAVASLDSSNGGGPFAQFAASGTIFGYVGSAAALAGGALADMTVRAQNNLILVANAVEKMRIDSLGNVVKTVTAAAPALTVNSTMVFSLTSNTNLRVSVRGTDGVTRVANLTLA